jgi:hypothetical protein
VDGGEEMNMDRNELMEHLHINEGDFKTVIYEKLFCAALLREGTETVARVLARYNEMKSVLGEHL